MSANRDALALFARERAHELAAKGEKAAEPSRDAHGAVPIALSDSLHLWLPLALAPTVERLWTAHAHAHASARPDALVWCGRASIRSMRADVARRMRQVGPHGARAAHAGARHRRAGRRRAAAVRRRVSAARGAQRPGPGAVRVRCWLARPLARSLAPLCALADS